MLKIGSKYRIVINTINAVNGKIHKCELYHDAVVSKRVDDGYEVYGKIIGSSEFGMDYFYDSQIQNKQVMFQEVGA
jgi:hypothetical protein